MQPAPLACVAALCWPTSAGALGKFVTNCFARRSFARMRRLKLSSTNAMVYRSIHGRDVQENRLSNLKYCARALNSTIRDIYLYRYITKIMIKLLKNTTCFQRFQSSLKFVSKNSPLIDSQAVFPRELRFIWCYKYITEKKQR
jgi:hypothetical protein